MLINWSLFNRFVRTSANICLVPIHFILITPFLYKFRTYLYRISICLAIRNQENTIKYNRIQHYKYVCVCICVYSCMMTWCGSGAEYATSSPLRESRCELLWWLTDWMNEMNEVQWNDSQSNSSNVSAFTVCIYVLPWGEVNVLTGSDKHTRAS